MSDGVTLWCQNKTVLLCLLLIETTIEEKNMSLKNKSNSRSRKTAVAQKQQPAPVSIVHTSGLDMLSRYLITGKYDYVPPAPTEPRRGWGPSIMQE